ncbi:MAG: hypothetical protein OZ934_13060 [Anaerolineae bacterium]|nr:hypothetical protein [Anaerolineae bacterium]
MTTSKHVRIGKSISWAALIVGIALGLAAGLFYTWEIDPVIERNTVPWQLGDAAREDYVVAVALSYAANQDLLLAVDRLRAAGPNRDVWEMVAGIACDRIKTGKTVSNSDIRVIRALEQLYAPQGASGCADGLYPTPAPVVFSTPEPVQSPTPTLAPPPSKTPTLPAPTPLTAEDVRPTSTPAAGGYALGRLQSFCDPDRSGVIEVRVYDRRGEGVPGLPVTVTWSGSERDSFFTGLKAEREAGYADFAMQAGRTYTISLPGLSAPFPTVEAVPCTAQDGQQAIASYWVNFQQRAD